MAHLPGAVSVYAHPELVAEQRRIFTAGRRRRLLRHVARIADVLVASAVAAVLFHWIIFH